MNAQLMAAAILVLAVLLGSARTLWLQRRLAPGLRPRAWRTGVLLLAQAISAALLYVVLFPPPVAREPGTLVVLTEDAGEVPDRGRPGERVVALPEFDGGGTCVGELTTVATGVAPTDCRELRGAGPGVERVPDLASALRRYPGTGRIRVIGAGLVARDRDAARGREIDFRPAPLPQGLIELQAPMQAPAGRHFEVTGRAERLKGGSAELRDPAGRRVDRTALDDDGGFALHAATRSAGLVSYRLQLRDARAQVVDDVAVPLQVTPGRSPRVLVLAGAPNPELKFLRRWALDAGAQLDTRISLGAGMQIGTAPPGFSADALDRIDLLVLDGRSWGVLDRRQRDTLDAAIDRGLGLLLRLDGPLTRADRERLRALGFTASTGNPAGETRLGGDFVRTGDAADALPALTRSELHVAATDGVVLLADAAGAALGIWRAQGRGRIGVSTLSDSYRLVLAGRGDVHGQVWSQAFTALARATTARADADIDAAAPGQRSVICGIGDDASVATPGGYSVTLHVDPATGAERCAGFWAEAAGWHRLHDGDRAMLFHVRDAASAPGLVAHAQREATQALVATGPRPDSAAPAARHAALQPGPRWPWFIAWLLLTTAAWWFERSRWGRPRLPAVGG